MKEVHNYMHLFMSLTQFRTEGGLLVLIPHVAA
jgi:hypothetical protein